MGRALAVAAGVFVLALVVLSWVLPLPLPRVNDIAFIDAKLVQASDIPKQDRDRVERALDGPFLRLSFTSSHDFQKLAQGWTYTIGWHASPCSGGHLDDKKLMDGYFALYDARGPISMYDARRPATSGPGPRFRYHAYLALKAEPNPDLPTDERQYAYDLRTHPQDVCVQFSGLQEVDGDGWGFAKFASNVVRVAKGVIAKALR